MTSNPAQLLASTFESSAGSASGRTSELTTVYNPGPTRAVNFLLTKLKKHGLFERAGRIRCKLYDSVV